MTTCWQIPENGTKYPEGFKLKLALAEVKKIMLQANDSKTKVYGAYVEMNEFSCNNINDHTKNLTKN